MRTNHLCVAISVVSAVIIASASESHAAEDVPELFTAISPELEPAQESDATLVRSVLVVLNESAYESLRYDTAEIGLSISLPLFEDLAPILVLEHRQAGQILTGWDEQSTPSGTAGYRWRGRLEDNAGSAVLAAFGDTLEGHIHLPNGTFCTITPYAGSICLVEEHTSNLEEACGSIDEEFHFSGLPKSQESESSSMLEGGSSCEEMCDTGAEVHILVVYTDAAKQAATGTCSQSSEAIHCRIINAIVDANQAFKNSNIELEMRLVGMLEVDYTETNLCDDLPRLTNSGDGYMDEVHRWRDYLNADLVCLISTSTYCDRAVSGIANIMATTSRDFEGAGFSVVNVAQINPAGSLFLFAHEVGHNFGCAHDRIELECVDSPECIEEPCISSGAYPFSFGYHFDAGNASYFTIMAYKQDSVDESVIQHFSNPDKNFQGVPTGVVGCDYSCEKFCDGCTLECDSADNARTIDQNRPVVAKFRRGCDPTGTKLASYNYLTPILGNADSTAPGMSDNGQRIIFTSEADNFADDENESTDVFLFNRESGSVRVVSHANGVGNENTTADGTSGEACISGGGFWVAFASNAPDLIVSGNTTKHIYVTDVLQMRMLRLSVSTCGTAANGACSNPSLSFSGRHLAFESVATNLVHDVDSGERHIYLRDRDVDVNGDFDEPCNSGNNTKTILVSADSDEVEGDGESFHPAVSGTGQYVAFESDAENLVSNDNNEHRDIFLRNVDATTTIRVSNGDEEETDGDSFGASISADGKYIAFVSAATNIMPDDGDTNGAVLDVFVYDRIYQTTTCVSVNSNGVQGNYNSDKPQISPDGRYVIFESENNFDSANGAGPVGIFVRDLLLEETYRVSLNSIGDPADDSCFNPCISDDARYFAFSSEAENLDDDDTNSYSDIFLRDLGRLVFGDLNGDLEVDQEDLDLLLQAWGECECCAADLDSDGDVDEDDYDLIDD